MEMPNEHIDYMGNASRPQNNLYSNTYNPRWRNHPNFSCGGQRQNRQNHPLAFQQQYHSLKKKSSLEDLMSKFIQTSKVRFQATKTSLRNQEASIYNLENQIDQLTNLISRMQQVNSPNNAELNLKEQVEAITLRRRRK